MAGRLLLPASTQGFVELDQAAIFITPRRCQRQFCSDVNDLISLSIEARRKRFGGEVHLVAPPNFDAPVGRPKVSLIKAIARVHSWYEEVVQGNSLDMRSLARQAGLTERYVGKVFGCALLAPDIIESILEGRQPQDLTFEKLCEHVPRRRKEKRDGGGINRLRS